MTKNFLHILIIFVLALFLVRCSTRKDRYINRAAHMTTTKYNVLYNGKLAYDTAKKELDDNYEDDFFQILPIEPLKIIQVIEGPMMSSKNTSKSAKVGFKRAEEKAVKAVQKHSMNFSGNEKNKYIDDTYFLLGKARYYDQRFVPALETFVYIIDHYAKSPLYNEAVIWQAKCLNRLSNEADALFILKSLLNRNDTPNEVKSEAFTTLAMVYMNYDSIPLAISALESSLKHVTTSNNQKARNMFVLGQLYRSEHNIEASNMAFNTLANFKKAPYKFKIHAQLERAKNYNKAADSTAQLVENLKKLAKDRDNRPYLDEIYYLLGKINLVNGDTSKAVCRFNKSLRTKIKHSQLQSLSYEELGDFNFDKAKFLDAGAYYDSVLHITVQKKNKRIRSIARKRKSLDKVIELENISSKNDSILALIAMSEADQIAFFNTVIKALKQKDKEAKIIAQNKKLANTSGFGTSLLGAKDKKQGGKFYFYNVQSVGFGEAEFKKIWGDRIWSDNWRLSNKNAMTNIEDVDSNEKEVVSEDPKDNPKYNVAYYLKQIPTDSIAISRIVDERNDAYYKLGVIYKEKFKKNQLATTKLEKLLSFSPKEALILPSYYHLYKGFESFDIEKSNYYKAQILSAYPESKYAKIILDPSYIDTNADKSTLVNNYNETYRAYISGEYQTVIADCDKYIILYANDAIAAKFELLRAYAIAKTKGKQDFIEALTLVGKNYADTEEAIHAKNVVASLNGEIAPKKKTKKPTKKVIKTKKKTKRRPMGPPGTGEMLNAIKGKIKQKKSK